MHISECANVWRVLQQLLGVFDKCESEKVSISSVRLRTSLHLRLFVCILHRLGVLLILGDQDEQKNELFFQRTLQRPPASGPSPLILSDVPVLFLGLFGGFSQRSISLFPQPLPPFQAPLRDLVDDS